MKYYVICHMEKPVALVFHDYVSARFIVRSSSEVFRKVFDAAVVLNSSLGFSKSDNKLKFNIFGPQFPSWIDKVLEKSCGDFWNIKKTGDITGDAFVEDIVQKFLSKL